MKPITLHPLSVLVGCVAVGLAFMLMGATQAAGSAQSIPVRDARMVGHIPSDWWVHVYVDYAHSFAVPAGHYFAVTLAAGNDVQANGVSAPLWPVMDNYTGDRNGTRVTFEPGTVLTNTQGNAINLWGYMEPVR